MSETSASLLERLRTSDGQAWERLDDLYAPLIRGWLLKHGVHPQEIEDLTQEVMTVLVRKLPTFRRDSRPGAFRCWLRAIAINCARDFWRSGRRRPRATGDTDFLQVLNELENPESELSRIWDEEHNQHVTRRLLEYIKPRFQPATWQAFERLVLQGESAEAVAAGLGISVNAVFIAKSRVLTLLRQEGAGLID